MVTFNSDGYTIHVTTVCPVEDWIEMQQQLCDVLSSVDENDRQKHGYYQVINLIRELTPDAKTAEKMV